MVIPGEQTIRVMMQGLCYLQRIWKKNLPCAEWHDATILLLCITLESDTDFFKEGEILKQKLKYDWEFQKVSVRNGVIPESYEEEDFYPVVIPHDWLIGQVENLYEDSVGWYRKRIELKPEAQRNYFLRFEGVYMDCTIFVNGREAGEWKYGYEEAVG